ncbi:MAG TPA: endonuclease III [Archaeoglobus profundus]|nr:endonuclease III [Archaeoglobus profundus]
MRGSSISNIEFWVDLLNKMEQEAKKRKAPVYTLNDNLTPFQHLITAILSTRTRDEQTAKAAKKLFRVAKTPYDIVKLSVEQIDELIREVGFHRVKARKIKELAEILISKCNSQVPSDFNELIKLPGVGRKVANIVLARAFNIPAIAVDTHVHRISNRMGIVRTKSPEETEKALMRIVPRELWARINKPFVGFGQTVCKPLKPLCNECPFKNCPKIGVKIS